MTGHVGADDAVTPALGGSAHEPPFADPVTSLADGTAGATPASPPEVPSGGPGGGGPQRRRPNRWKLAFFAVTAVGIVAAASWALLGSRFLVVRSIEVAGNHLVPRSQVLAAAQIPHGLPLVRVNTTVAAHRIERITQVQSASVTRQWPDRVLITVRERIPSLAVRAGSEFDLVDASGVVVRQAAAQPRGMPLFTPAGPVLRSPGVRAAVTVLRDLPARLARRVKSVAAADGGAVILHLSGAITVNWGDSSQSAQKARELSILLRTHARYYDVSAPGTATTG